MRNAQSELQGAVLELTRANADLLSAMGLAPEPAETHAPVVAPFSVVEVPGAVKSAGPVEVDVVARGAVEVDVVAQPAVVPESVHPEPVAPAAVVTKSAPVEFQAPRLEPADFDQSARHEAFATVLSLARLRENVLLAGPMGCGKTLIAGQVATELCLPFGSQSCSAGMSESQITGWLLPVGDSGRFEYVPSLFVTLYENGGVFLLDEVDAADENTVLILNNALSGDSWHLPQRFHNPVVKRHPDFVCIGAANSLGGGNDIYTGRTRLDGATLDRFRSGVVVMDYDAHLEGLVVDPDVLAWGTKLRAWMRAVGMNRALSTRVLVRYSKQNEAGIDQAGWERSYMADWSQSERERWYAACQD